MVIAAGRRDEEAELVRHSRELLAHDRLSELASKTRKPVDISHSEQLGNYVQRLSGRDKPPEHDRISVGSLESEGEDLAPQYDPR